MSEELFITKPMMVMEIRPEFSIQYKASPKLKLKKEHICDKKAFIEHLKKTTKNWKSGRYFLRSDVGPFAEFHISKERKFVLEKENKHKMPYLCWQFFASGKSRKK